MTLFNILGYAAIRKLTENTRPDVGKPLGLGLPSKMQILGGEVRYGEHRSTHPLFQVDALKGTVGTITGMGVVRAPDGRLHAIVNMRSPYPQVAEINKLMGLDAFEFFSADEYISSDVEKPTIFQNFVEGRVEPGMKVRLLPGMPEIALPVGFTFSVFTEATGFVRNDAFEGVLSFDYNYQIIRGRPSGIAQVDHLIRSAPSTAQVIGEGQFHVLVSPVR